MFSFSKSSHNHRGKIIQKWTFNAKSPILSSAIAIDIDKDGKKEIVFGTNDGKIYCLGEDSSQKWVFAIDDKLGAEESFFYDSDKIDSIPATPTIKDVNNDGKLEIVFGTELGTIYCLNSMGKLLWKYKGNGATRGRIVVDDIDNDGGMEIMFGTNNGEFVILDNKGKQRHLLNVENPILSEASVLHHGQTQIIFGSEDGKIHSFNPNGEKLWDFQAKSAVRARPTFGKLVSDQDIIIGDSSGILYCLDLNGEEQWRFSTEGAILGAATLADLNNDDVLEIVVGSCDNRVYCLSHRGEKLWSYETDFWIVTAPIVTDIDGDGSLEVVVGSFDQNLYVLDGEGAYNLDYMPGLAGIAHQAGHYTDVLTSEPGEQIGKRLWHIKTQGMIVGCEELGDNNIIVNIKTGYVDDIAHTE